MYTQSEVLDFIEEEDVKFIRLAFFDLKGKQKNISIMPSELNRAFENGIPFDASAIEGFAGWLTIFVEFEEVELNFGSNHHFNATFVLKTLAGIL